MSNSASAGSSSYQEQRTFLGHPIGLFVLFFTELWERFSYYGMRALLVLYMVEFFKWTQESASGVYKWYTALVYLTPIAGGFLADKFLGNKWAIIIGGAMMAVGQFLLTIPDVSIFYIALGFMIVGNGFFKPNMSVQVGRLYPQNDPRRDGAYTIFYMGINVGAFLSPLVCGALRESPGLGYKWGFAAAGVGMIVGLIVYLLGLPFVKELPPDMKYEAKDSGKGSGAPASKALTEAEAEKTQSVIPSFSKLSPQVFYLLGVVLAVGAPIFGALGLAKWDNAITAIIAAFCAFFAGWILSKLTLAVRDRVLAIYAVFVFVVFFWGAFEQAGNAMNVWADQTTNRFLTEEPPVADVYPDQFVATSEQPFWELLTSAFGRLIAFNPVLTTSFQSINAAGIVFFAPVFAWLWVYLARRNLNPSIATKMAIGVFFQGIAFALMIWAAKYANGPSETDISQLPSVVFTRDGDKVFFHDSPDLTDDKAYEARLKKEFSEEEAMIAQGGRMVFDKAAGKLKMTGVLDANHRDRMLRATAPDAFITEIKQVAADTAKAKAEADKKGEKSFTVEHQFVNLPDGFDAGYLRGFDPEKIRYDAAERKLILKTELADNQYKQILVAAADPEFRRALNELFVASVKFRVSSMWLFWFYILCTIGELCLSPVGLSMVSKLAPRRFATMLMGMWLLTSFFGNFAAGLAGENWERLDPGSYFTYITIAMVIAAAICYGLAKRITSMMHGAN